MKKIIILQLARLGDILQTLPAIQGLKKKYPESKISLVVRNKFSDAAKISPYIDEIIELPTKDILSFYVEKPSIESKQKSLDSLTNWYVQNFKNTQYDLLINLTFTESSSWLATIIQANEKRGVIRAEDGAISMKDLWSQYFYAQVLQKNYNILHLNDLFVRISGVDSGFWPVEIKDSFKINANSVIPAKNNVRRVGIQLTASQAIKSPSIATWALICSKIYNETGAELVFFGSQQDLPIIEMVISQAGVRDNSIVLAGTYRFDENIPWIKSCDCIVSPDTAIVHLASICGTRVVCIPMGGVRSEETGPYGIGHSVLYPANATPEVFSSEIVRVIVTGKAKLPVPQAVTKLTATKNGQMRNELVPSNFEQDENINLFQNAYYLLAEFRNEGRLEEVTIPKVGKQDSGAKLDELIHVHDTLFSMRKAADFGSHYCMIMAENTHDTVQLKDCSKKLMEVDALLNSLENNRYVKPLIDSWKIAKGNILNPDLKTMILQTEGAYRELQQNIDIVFQLLETAVTAAQNSVQKTKTTNVNESVNKEIKI